LDSSAWDARACFAHIVFHRLCAKLEHNVDKAPCLKNGLRNFSLTNQRPWRRCVRLRTILSTKNVQRRARAGDWSRVVRCLIFEHCNFLDLNQQLISWKCYFAQIYPQKMWASRVAAWMSLLQHGNSSDGCFVFTHGKISF
jgi:hypothetical protein